MKSLVTGGKGFIGGHIVDRLVELGQEVIVIDDASAESNGYFHINPKASYFNLQIEDYDSILPLFGGIDYVFHLAAESRIQPSLGRPQKVCSTNFVGTCSVLNACREHRIKRMIYSGTSSAYGRKNPLPYREDMPRDCLTPYSVSKAAAEDLCRMYHSLWGVETVTLRYFNVYGERQPLKGLYAPVIGLFLRQRSEGGSLSIVGDGRQRRDFTYINDVVDANILAALSSNKRILGEIFNIGTGKNYSILEIADMVGGKKTFFPPRLGESKETLADISKAKTELNYSPKTLISDWIKAQS